MLKVSVEIKGATDALGRLPPTVVDAIRTKVRILTLKLQQHIVADKLQGQVLHHRSGALGRSIQTLYADTAGGGTGSVYSSGDVKYAAIHEFGGRTKPHDIFPKKAEALSFMMGGKQIFAKVVHHPGSNIPERSFMRSGLADMADEIVAGLKQAALEGAKKAVPA